MNSVRSKKDSPLSINVSKPSSTRTRSAKDSLRFPVWGKLLATAIIASISEPQRFKNGRQFAAYLGLVPRQHSTGGKPKLLGISKAGNRYLRMLLIHGARSIIYHHRAKPDARSRWLQKLVERRGFHKANVALANKNARVVWKLLTTPGEEFMLPLAA